MSAILQTIRPGRSYYVRLPQSSWEAYVAELRSAIHPADFWTPAAETGDKPPAIEVVRDCLAFAASHPFATHKIIVLPWLDELAPASAHTLLKLTEEPAEFLTFIGLSSRGAFLPTLASRLQELEWSGRSATMEEKDSSFAALARRIGDRPSDTAEDRSATREHIYRYSLLHGGMTEKSVDAAYRHLF